MDFDPTKAEEDKQALERYEKYGWVYHPFRWLLKKASDSFFQPNRTYETTELMKSGEINDVDIIETTSDSTTGIDIQAYLFGIPVKAMIGKSQRETRKIRFKNLK